MLALAISSCDEDTSNMGNTLTGTVDRFVIATDTFDVTTRSIKADSVLCRSPYTYLGCVKDPETGSYITSDFTTQFSLLEDEASNVFIHKDSVISRDADNQPIADSCFVSIMVNAYMGDSLAALKLCMYEMSKPLEENKFYYTNFSPAEEGYLRDDGFYAMNMFSISDLTLSDSLRNMRRNGTYYEAISIPMNDVYKDTQGNMYNNYGTYIMRQYYQHPEYFKNSQTFREKVCPGFYFDIVNGSGVMAEIAQVQLTVYYRAKANDATYVFSESFRGTEEVLQTSHFTDDDENLDQLVSETRWTYMKAPDGIFTEVTLPVDDIKLNHEKDTLTSARIIFRGMKEKSELSEELLQEPENMLMVKADSLYSFFEERNLPNNITSYLATYNSSWNTYSFNNISGLINDMYAHRGQTKNWNKVVLVPVQITTTATSTSTSTTTSTVASVSNEMRVTSVRLVGGSDNEHEPVRISVGYNTSK